MHKWLRGVGIALVAMPEPFTTPFGVALLGASLLLARQQEMRRRAYLRHLMKEYIRSYKRLSPGDRYDPESLPFKYKEALYQPEKAPAPRVGSRGYSWPDRPKLEPEIVRHALDLSRIQRRRDSGGSRRGFEGYWGARSYEVIRPNQRSPRPVLFSAS